MAIDRRTIISGPAILTFRGATFYTTGGITVDPGITLGQIITDQHGKVDDFLDNIVSTVTFTPAGQWIPAHIDVLYPYRTPQIGSSIFGATDDDVVIQSLDGQRLTLKTGGITQMPALSLSAIRPPFGQCTITCIGANDTEWTDTAKRAVLAAQAFADASFRRDQIKMAAYYASLAGATGGWGEFSAAEGWTITPEVQTYAIDTDAEGTCDIRLAGVNLTASCIPVGITESEMLAQLPFQGANIRRGQRLSKFGKDLTIAGKESGDPTVTIKSAVLTNAPFIYNAQSLRNGEAVFQSSVSFNDGGLMQPLFTLGLVA